MSGSSQAHEAQCIEACESRRRTFQSAEPVFYPRCVERRPTIGDYIVLLERSFLLEQLPPWHSNRLRRLVKAAATVTPTDFRGLRKLAAAAGDRFAHGVVLYDGEVSARCGDRLYAVPIRRLWETS